MPANRYVQVALNLPLKDVFDYSVPENMRDLVAVGKRVWVPFRNRTIVGYIVSLSPITSIKRTRDIKEVIDKVPLLGHDLLELTRWMSEYYFCSWGEAIEAAVAGPFKKGKTTIRLRKDQDVFSELDPDSIFQEKILTHHQDKALTQINPFLDEQKFKVFLMHGITASGKTEVYFEAIQAVLDKGKEAIVFVPEIALTPQTMQRFTEKFGKDRVAVVHSRLNKSEKFMQWQRIKSGEAKIVVGARSAIFSPLKNLGLIVVDEEHENTYKQEDIPRYHLVNAAIKRAQISNAVVILGSATPSLESMYQSKNGTFEFIDLPERIEGRYLPKIQVADMRIQQRRGHRQPIISKVLEDSIAKSLGKKEQVILFLNRRGFSTFIHCRKCGYVVLCPKCNVSLVYHFDRKELICHHCNHHSHMPKFCPECNGDYIRYLGTGTQKVESELHRLFPKAKISRMDSDALKKKTAHFDIFKDFKSGKIDILVGTQMLAKGLDFPNVTLVGVISADVTLNLPDFRASERTFSLLTQVAGRAGRGSAPGKVIIQTYTPEHYSIKFAIAHDYNSFYDQEMVFRKELKLPPYMHLVSLILRSKEEDKLNLAIEQLGFILKKKNCSGGIEIMGPMPMPISKLKGYYRSGIILKSKEVLEINSLLKSTLQIWKPRTTKVKMAVDIDPTMVI